MSTVPTTPTKAQPLRPIAEKAPAGETRQPARRDLVEGVWNLFCSIRFAVVLNIALALAAMLGTVIPQLPVGVQNFPDQLSQFLADGRTRYGDFSGMLYWAGFYDLYNSLWFRLLVLTVVFSIIICTLNRWQPVVRLIMRPVVRSSDAFLAGLTEKALFRGVATDLDGAENALRTALKKGRFRSVSETTADGQILYLYADRDRWSKMVTFVSHAALVLLILTAAFMQHIGWRDQSVFLYPGEPVAVGHGTDFSVRMDNFAIEYYPDGASVKEYKDTLAIVAGERDVLTKTIIVNDPLRYQGINFFLVSYQPILYATASDHAGNKLSLRRMGASGPITSTNGSGEALVAFNFTSQDNLPEDLIQLPVKDHVLTLDLTYYQDVTRAQHENPPVYVKGYVDKNFDKPIYDAFLPRTGPLQLPGYGQYSFSFRSATASVLEIAWDPGLWLPGLWFTIMALGFTISLYTTFTRCWAKVTPSQEHPGTVNVVLGGLAEKNKVTFERDFERLATRVRDNLARAVAAGEVGREEKSLAVEQS